MDKTYVFDNAGSGFGDMSGLVASLCQHRGLDPNMVMAMMNNRGVGYGNGYPYGSGCCCNNNGNGNCGC